MHGAVPDIAGRNLANPIALVWSGVLMLNLLTRGSGVGRAARDAIVRAIETVLHAGPRTPELTGNASTQEVGQALAAQVMAEGR